ncbi:MAG: ABC transporter permease, partial [Firmicutes bacterium]|nr:ABC transporter permease [Bacillota bacterium]
MVATIIRRLLIVIPQIFIISLVIFGLAWIMPGDFVSQRRMMEEHVTLNEILLMRERFGLDDPWYQQYLRWLGSALRGDFGMSF